MNRINFLNPAVVYTDKIWNPNLNPYIKNNSIHNIFQSINKDIELDGCIVFDTHDSLDIFSYIHLFEEADYCAMLIIDNIILFKFIKIDINYVMYCETDTESG